MKTIGLIGGMSWESTVPYYQIINRMIGERLGGFHSAKILLHSIDFSEIESLQRADRWDDAGAILADVGAGLEAAGAECLALCCNTMHRVAPAIEARTRVPLLHIADATARAVVEAGCRKVGLIGTRFTMEGEFLRSPLKAEHGVEMILPPDSDRGVVHRVIYEELCRGKVLDSSRQEYRRIIGELAARGAQGVILGCTEIAMLVGADDSPVPLFDTAAIHARAVVLFALGESE